MIKTIKTNQENVKLTIFSSTEDSFLVTSTLVEKDGHALLINAKFTQSDATWFGPKCLEHFLYDFFTHFLKFNWC